MNILWCLLLGYLLGSINPSYLIGLIKGFDIRKKGSGNAGASNALIVMGKWVAIFSAAFDIAKAWFSYWFAESFLEITVLDYNISGAIAGAACIIGHILPAVMKFKGGKGLACLGGVVLAFDTKVFLVMLMIELVLVFIVDYICIVPMTAAIIFPSIFTALTKNWIGGLILLIPGILMFLKHIENIKRIRKGQEAHLSFLWKRNEEIARITRNDSQPDEADSEK